MYTECHLFCGKAIEQHASTRSSAKDAQAWFPELKKSDSLNNVRPSSTRHKQTDGGKAVQHYSFLTLATLVFTIFIHLLYIVQRDRLTTIWGSLLLQCNSEHPCYCNANATALHPCYCGASASLLLQMLLHCIPATALHPCYCTALLQM